MSAHHSSSLNGPRKRARKRTLAARDGAWCAYCGRLFADLRHATIDHVVPISLYRTWRAEHTVLACHPCNEAKADRLPLLLALLILDRHGHPDADQSADAAPAGVGHGLVFTPDVCALLARLADAAESGAWPDRSPDASADPTPDQSRADQGGHVVRALATDPTRTAYAVRASGAYAHVTRRMPNRPYAGLEAA